MLAASIPGAVPMRQFENPANPRIHYETTGPEIWEQMDGKVDGIAFGVASADDGDVGVLHNTIEY